MKTKSNVDEMKWNTSLKRFLEASRFVGVIEGGDGWHRKRSAPLITSIDYERGGGWKAFSKIYVDCNFKKWKFK